MKNLDRIYGLSKSQLVLDELSTRLNIDYFIRSQSNQLLSSYKEIKKNWDEQDSDYIVRISIFISSRLRTCTSESSSLISLSTILRDLPSLHEFMVKLKDFISLIALDCRVKSDMQSILSNYAFSLTLFNKFEELWAHFPSTSEVLKQISWTIFVLSRVNLIQRRVEIVECACMLVGTIFIVLTHSDLQVGSESECLTNLCGVIKGQPDQIRISANHLKKMLELFIKHRIIVSGSGIKGIFSLNEIKSNYERLSFEYIHKLLPSEFDQRLFIEKEGLNIGSIRTGTGFLIKSVIDYKFSYVSFFNEHFDIVFVKRELNNSNFLDWVQETFKETDASLVQVTQKILENWQLGQIFSENNGIVVSIASYFSRTIKDNFSSILTLSVLVYSSIYKVKIDLEKILNLSETCAFDLWKNLKTFISQEIPEKLFKKLQKTSLVLITSVIWTDNNFLMNYKNLSKKDLGQQDIKDFLSDLLFYSSFTIREVSKLLMISEKVQEEVWMIFKSCLTQECEILLSRNLHQIIVCCIYGLSKAKNLNVTFNSIVSKLVEIDPKAEILFRKISIEEGTGDIIKYYNEEFLKYMKTYLLSVSRTPTEIFTTPLGVSNGLNPQPSFNLISSPVFTTPFTPGTRRMFEFGESPIEQLNHFNRMLTKNTRTCLSFEEEKGGIPSKRPKFTEEIYKEEDEIMDLPGEIPGFKDDNLL